LGGHRFRRLSIIEYVTAGKRRSLPTALHPNTFALAEFANVIVIYHRLSIALNGEHGCGAVGRADRQPCEPYVLVTLLKGYGFAGSEQLCG
jgi:hypothetical protein